VQADAGPGPAHALAEAQVQLPFGRYEVAWEQLGRTGSGRAGLAGGVVMLDRSIFFTRPVEQGYAVVQVPGVEGVRVSLENQEIGRTDDQGNVLVTTLLPYYANRLSIRGEDVPMEYDVGPTERLVATTRRGGARVRFAVERIAGITGRLEALREGRLEPPAHGEIALETGGERIASPVGADGRFWLERVPPGRHAAEVVWRGAVCRAALVVPPGASGVVDLGTLRCAADQALARAAPSHPE
jgi:outer membrane usher protein